MLLPDARLVPAGEDDAAAARLARENTWTVRDGAGDATRAAGLAVLLRASPLLRPLHHAFRFGPFGRLADRVYGWVADHRPRAAQATRWLHPRPLRWRLPLAAQLVALLLLLDVFVWNLAGVRNFPAPLPQPVRALHLDQHWGMFAPYPRLDDGWYVVEGDLEGGEQVDVFRAVISRQGDDLRREKPEPVAAAMGGVLWTKYFEHLLRSEDRGRYGRFAGYLCRTWNAANTGERRLVRFDMYFMLEHTERLDRPPEKIHLWWQTC